MVNKKVTVRDLILTLHDFDLDAEVRIKKDGKYVEGATLVVNGARRGIGALFG